jgi:hypothetical protein
MLWELYVPFPAVPFVYYTVTVPAIPGARHSRTSIGMAITLDHSSHLISLYAGC